MWKKYLTFLNIFCGLISNAYALENNDEHKVNQEKSVEEITGYWKSIDDKTGKAQSLVLIYPYQDKYFGRIMVTYNEDGSIADTIYQPKSRAPGIIGDPYYAGMDIIWNLHKEGNKYSDGKIVDPERGAIYDAELWIDKGNLIVRGELLFFGQNQTWLKAKESDFPPNFEKPNLNELTPVIPEVKR